MNKYTKTAIHHGLLSYNSSNLLCRALCSENTRASKGLVAGYTQSFSYALGMSPPLFWCLQTQAEGSYGLANVLSKRPRLKYKNGSKSVICWSILMKFCMQLSNGHPFPLTKFQLGRKGQRPEGRKVKDKNFKKLVEAVLTVTQALSNGFLAIFALKIVILENLVVSVHCGGWDLLNKRV